MKYQIGDKIEVIDKFMQNSFKATIHSLLNDPYWIVASWSTEDKIRFGLCCINIVFEHQYINSKVIPIGLKAQFRCMEYGNSLDAVIESRNEWFKSQTQVLRKLDNGN